MKKRPSKTLNVFWSHGNRSFVPHLRHAPPHAATSAHRAPRPLRGVPAGIGFGPLAPDFLQSSQPSPGRCGHCGIGEACGLACLADLERLIAAEGPDTVAAVIAEPVAIPQAVKIPHPDYFARLRRLCDANGILLIIDEVVSGFGRTGRLFGAEHFAVMGDIVTYAKGLTSGYVPMGAVAVSAAVNSVFETDPLLHLNTYAGHPVACAAGSAALDIMERERLVARAAALEPVLRRELERLCQAVARVREVSVIGLLSSVVCDVADRADPNAVSAGCARTPTTTVSWHGSRGTVRSSVPISIRPWWWRRRTSSRA
jgi:adenosylmethionine-8-amino-7-oxononanoate aminotransferase